MKSGWKLTEEQRQHQSEAKKGHKPTYTGGSPGYVWYNNGVDERLVKPGTVLEGEGWVQGRLFDMSIPTEASCKSPNRNNIGKYWVGKKRGK